ncbi:phage tail assembly chaperone [Aeromonas enteropelogenes]|uniref:phage tail assembly chaperone n=1 Tax=Aeromonas enteropelogenes TaxID=29489 RepID=UPI003BA2A3D4
MNNIDWSQKITPSMRAAEIAKSVRALRDSKLSESGWLVERHRDELEHLTSTALSAEQYVELQAYRQQLRDWPEQPGWPNIEMPSPPDWLALLLK